jgi:hypothetical protein
MRTSPWSVPILMFGLIPAPLVAQRLQPGFHQAVRESRVLSPTGLAVAFQNEARPSRSPFVTTGAIIGGVVTALTLGPALVEAEVGSEPLIYGLSAAGGAVVGALLGLLVYEIRHGN